MTLSLLKEMKEIKEKTLDPGGGKDMRTFRTKPGGAPVKLNA
jgi:hypothetical protein